DFSSRTRAKKCWRGSPRHVAVAREPEPPVPRTPPRTPPMSHRLLLRLPFTLALAAAIATAQPEPVPSRPLTFEPTEDAGTFFARGANGVTYRFRGADIVARTPAGTVELKLVG